MTRVISIERQRESLMERCASERKAADPSLIFPIHLTLDTAVALIGNLQLALRHPQNVGISAKVARMTIDGVIGMLKDQGLVAYAELARLGDDPVHDG